MWALLIYTSIFLTGTVLSLPLLDALPEDLIDISHLGEAVFGDPTDRSGKKLENWNPESGENADEVGEYLEGDILVPKSLGRNGLKREAARWPNGRIPYEITGRYTGAQYQTIQAAMNDYHNKTCIRFVPRTRNDEDYLSIGSANTGCWSSVGRIGGRQEVNLQSPGCLTKKGTVIHELMHAVGFLHEQNRFERDHHVTIEWDNILKGRDNNFKKAKKEETNAFGVSYDYRSVMHYSGNAFSSNGSPTIVPKIDGVQLGQREGFSRHDVLKIKNMYHCKDDKIQNDGGLFGLFG